MASRLGRSFFRGGTVEVARRLLGTRLVNVVGERRVVGRIVEVEAYLAEDDPASHSRMGPTARNASMFLGPGHAYVYRIYGMHHCFNVVTAEAGRGEAVLVRALEPLEGLDLMRELRGPAARTDRLLCSGPGRLVQALGIEPIHDGHDLTSRGPGPWLLPDERTQTSAPTPRRPADSSASPIAPPIDAPVPGPIAAPVSGPVAGPRIGIRVGVDLPLRFSLDGPWLSKPC